MGHKLRQYACGIVVHEDDFAEHDNSQPYYDDYEEIDIPDWVYQWFEEMLLGGSPGVEFVVFQDEFDKVMGNSLAEPKENAL